MRVTGICEDLRPTIVIPDVHETTFWERFVSLRRPGDRVVFLGDYFARNGRGPFAESAIRNFLKICAYARENPDTHILMGNHDFELTSFSLSPADWEIDFSARHLAIMTNLDILEMVYVDGDTIFAHGGVTQSFMDNNGLTYPEEINNLWRDNPKAFNWLETDPVSGQKSDFFGDDPWQSPLWTRTLALLDGAEGYNQVVGHTPVRAPEIMRTIHRDNILLTCTLDDLLIRIGR
ncbi:MAG: metallophosphoesterase [Desulfovibrio sp.]|nr:metallophosphoesterase [Desulfovibrio sp.]